MRWYPMLWVMSPRQVCSFASQKYARSLKPARDADFDCPELLPKAAVTISEAVAAVDV